MSRDEAAISRIQERHARLASDDHYTFLGVAADADVAAIRAAYRELARDFHQDRYQGMDLDATTRAQLQAVFARLTEAQSTLTNPDKRKAYDASLRGEPDADAEVSVDTMKAIFAAEEAFRRGKMHLERGQFDKALERFEAVLAANPDDADALTYFHFARFVTEPLDRKGKRNDAARASLRKLEELSRVNDAPVTATLLYAKALRLEERLDEAERLFKRVQRAEPRNADAERELRLIQQRKASGGAAQGGILGKLKEILTRKR